MDFHQNINQTPTKITTYVVLNDYTQRIKSQHLIYDNEKYDCMCNEQEYKSEQSAWKKKSTACREVD